MAVAARIGDYLVREGDVTFRAGTIDRTAAAFRRDLSPPDTFGHGMPVR